MTHGSLRSRRFLFAFAFLLALVVLVVALANQTFRALSSANRWSLHTHRVLAVTDELQAGIAEMEAGFRGYALTRDPRFLQQWRDGMETLRRREPTLRSLTADNPPQHDRLVSAETAFREWLVMQRESGVLRPEMTRDEAIAVASEPRARAGGRTRPSRSR